MSDVTVQRLETAVNHRHEKMDRVDLPFDRPGIILAQGRRASADTDRHGRSRLDGQKVGAEALNACQNELVRTGADGDIEDHGCEADDSAEDRQGPATKVGTQGSKGHAQRIAQPDAILLSVTPRSAAGPT